MEASGTGAQVADVAPRLVGQWTEPFEEGGAAVPRCTAAPDGALECKPAAANLTTLPDGRILYYNGFEGSENQKGGAATDLAPLAAQRQRAAPRPAGRHAGVDHPG